MHVHMLRVCVCIIYSMVQIKVAVIEVVAVIGGSGSGSINAILPFRIRKWLLMYVSYFALQSISMRVSIWYHIIVHKYTLAHKIRMGYLWIFHMQRESAHIHTRPMLVYATSFSGYLYYTLSIFSAQTDAYDSYVFKMLKTLSMHRSCFFSWFSATSLRYVFLRR